MATLNPLCFDPEFTKDDVAPATTSQESQDDLETGNAVSAVKGWLNQQQDDIIIGSLLTNSLRNENSPLKAVITNYLYAGMQKAIKDHRKLGKLIIGETLKPEEEATLVINYPEFDICFSRNINVNHGYAAASRKAERLACLVNIGYVKGRSYDAYLKDHGYDVYVKDIGGDPTLSIVNEEGYIHCCTPILDAYDETRVTLRNNKVQKVLSGGNATEKQTRGSAGYTNQRYGGGKSSLYCTNKAQRCTVKANYAIAIHSVYDMSVVEFADACDAAGVTEAHGTFFYHPAILFVDEYVTKPTKMKFEKFRHNGKEMLQFSFLGDDGHNYVHNARKYMEWITVCRVISSKGTIYIKELLSNKSGVQFFRFVRTSTGLYVGPVPRSISFLGLSGTYLITAYEYDYDMILGSSRKAPRPGLMDNKIDPAWFRENTIYKRCRFFADKSLVDKLIEFARGSIEEKFKPDAIYNIYRSLASREMYGSAVLGKDVVLSPKESVMLISVVYVYVYVTKFDFGKIMQQQIADIDYCRNKVYKSNGFFDALFGDRPKVTTNYGEDTLMGSLASIMCGYGKHSSVKIDPAQMLMALDGSVRLTDLSRRANVIKRDVGDRKLSTYDYFNPFIKDVVKEYMESADLEANLPDLQPAPVHSDYFKVSPLDIVHGINVFVGDNNWSGETFPDSLVKHINTLSNLIKFKCYRRRFDWDVDIVNTVNDLTENSIFINSNSIIEYNLLTPLKHQAEQASNTLEGRFQIINVDTKAVKGRRYDFMYFDMSTDRNVVTNSIRVMTGEATLVYKHTGVFDSDSLKFVIKMLGAFDKLYVTDCNWEKDSTDVLLTFTGYKVNASTIRLNRDCVSDLKNFIASSLMNTRFLQRDRLGQYIIGILDDKNDTGEEVTEGYRPIEDEVVNYNHSDDYRYVNDYEKYIDSDDDGDRSTLCDYEIYVQPQPPMDGLRSVDSPLPSIDESDSMTWEDEMVAVTTDERASAEETIVPVVDDPENVEPNVDVVPDTVAVPEIITTVVENRDEIIEEHSSEEEYLDTSPVDAQVNEDITVITKTTELENDTVEIKPKPEVTGAVVKRSRNRVVTSKVSTMVKRGLRVLKTVIRDATTDFAPWYIAENTKRSKADGYCAYYAMTGNRSISVKAIKRELTAVYPEMMTEGGHDQMFDDQGRPKQGDLDIIDAYGKLYGFKYDVQALGIEKTHLSVGELKNPGINMKVVYTGDGEEGHYDHYTNCDGVTPSKLERTQCHRLNTDCVLKTLSKIVKFTEVEYIEDIGTAPGTYLFNNMYEECGYHDECKLNKFPRYYQYYTEKLLNKGVKLILIVQQTTAAALGHFAHAWVMEARMDGYSFILLSDAKNSQSIADSWKITRYPVTGNAIYKPNLGRFGPSNIVTMSTIDDNGIQPDLVLKVKREKDCPDFEMPYVMEKYDYRNYTVYFKNDEANVNQTREVMVRFERDIASITHSGVYHLHIVSDFTGLKQINEVVEKYTIHVTAICTVNNGTRIGTYLAEASEEDKMRNCMTEERVIWNNERAQVMCHLRKHWPTVINMVNSPKGMSSLPENDLVLYDVVTKQSIYPVNHDVQYHWGYDGNNLVDTSDLSVFRTKHPNTRYLLFSSSSKLLHGVTWSRMYNFVEVTDFKAPDIEQVLGVPGGGKSSYIIKSYETYKKNNPDSEPLILTTTKEAKFDMLRRIGETNQNHVRTMDSFLVRPQRCDKLWIDEALLMHCGKWIWAMHLTKATEVVIAGDKAQIPHIDRNGNHPVYSKPHFYMKTTYLSTTYRCPMDITKWLSKIDGYAGFDVKTTSNVGSSVKTKAISSVAQVPVHSGVHYLTFSQLEKAELKAHLGGKARVNSVHEYQGNQNDTVYLVRTILKEASDVYKSQPHTLVALSRHTKKFRYFSVLKDYTWKELKKIEDYRDHDFKSVKKPKLAGGGRLPRAEVEFPPFEYEYEGVVKTKVYKPESAVQIYHLGPDVLERIHEFLGDSSLSDVVEVDVLAVGPEPEYPKLKPINDEGVILQSFFNRVLPGCAAEYRLMDHLNFEYSDYICEVSHMSMSRTYPIFKKYEYAEPFLTTSIQPPLHSSRKILVKAFMDRNGNPPELQGTVDHNRLVGDLITNLKKLYVDRAVDYSNKPIRIDYDGLDRWLQSQKPSVRSVLKSDPQSLWDSKFTHWDFMVKNVAKVDLEPGAEFRLKSPQTICYQRKKINAYFAPMLRNVFDRLLDCLPEDVILFNGMTAVAFSRLLTARLPGRRYKRLQKFLEIDFSKYDKSQNYTALLFEIAFFKMMGLTNEVINMWVLMHRTTILHNRAHEFRAKVEYQRKSGDAGTWLMNTVYQMAILNSELDLWRHIRRGNCVAAFSGDDSILFFEHYPSDYSSIINDFQYRYNLEAKVLKFTTPYFCSKFLIMTYDGWKFVPDTVKLVSKLGRMDLINDDHVEQYRISFNDNLHYYRYPQYWMEISAAINNRYHLDGEHDIVFQALLSVAGSQERFKNLYKVVASNKPISVLPSLEL